MKILIIEDEQLLADELEETILSLRPSYHVVAKLGSIEESVEWLTEHMPDLIFCDVQLSDGLSFSIFEKVSTQCPIIFTTAFDDYALRAFEHHSMAYLLKPIVKEDVERTFEKLSELTTSYTKLSEILPQKADNRLERLTLTKGPLKLTVDIDDIILFEADDRYVFAHTCDGKRYFCAQKLKELEEHLPSELFFRINRTYILNKKHIAAWQTLSNGTVSIFTHPSLDNSIELQVSRQRSADFIQWIEL